MAGRAKAARRSLPTYLVVGPFAILLAFPFYWMLVTMLKEDLDLYNAENVPYVYNPLQWRFWESATTKHVEFLFTDTHYLDWVVNTTIVFRARPRRSRASSTCPTCASMKVVDARYAWIASRRCSSVIASCSLRALRYAASGIRVRSASESRGSSIRSRG